MLHPAGVPFRRFRVYAGLDQPGCADALREFTLYCWDEKAGGDRVKKVHDHAMDDIRYFVTTILCREEEGFYALATERR